MFHVLRLALKVLFEMFLFSASYVRMYDAVQCCVAYSQCTRCWYYKPARSFFLSFPFPCPMCFQSW